MTQEKLKCDGENCEDEAVNHATYEQTIPSGYETTIRTHHLNFCFSHLSKAQSEFFFIKVFELGKCEDADCNSGNLPRLN